jgi:hypothetical protein
MVVVGNKAGKVGESFLDEAVGIGYDLVIGLRVERRESTGQGVAQAS